MLRVIYIVGYGYSGSTLLDILLGNHPAVESVGELCNLHTYGWARNKRCACGKPGRDCLLWSRAMSRWQELSGSKGVEDYIRLQRKVESWINPFASFRPKEYRSNHLALRRYIAQTTALFQAIAEISSKSCIVDSSKLPLRAKVLLQIPSLDLRIIHLVRDLRGVLWSLLKRKKRNQPIWPIVFRGVLGWNIANIQAERIRNSVSGEKWHLIRYEDLATHPQVVLQEIEPLAELSLSEIGKRFEDGETIRIGHIIAGNRIRKLSGLHLSADFAWKTHLPPTVRWVAELLGGPLMRRYGYLSKGP